MKLICVSVIEITIHNFLYSHFGHTLIHIRLDFRINNEFKTNYRKKSFNLDFISNI